MILSIEHIWGELQTLGFKGAIQSIEELYKWIRTVHLVHIPPLLKQNTDGSLVYNSIHLNDVTISMTGAFGVLYLVYRENGTDAQYTFLKTSPTHPSSLLLEGILQSIAHSVLVQYNFPKAIPRVLDIIKHPSLGVALVLEKQPGARLFSDYLKTHVKWGSPCKSNDILFLSVLAQIATYLAILEVTIGMNHRDLTGTNVLMVDPYTPVHQSVQLNELTWKIHSNHQAILIDFGFACIGEHTGKSIASAGEYLPTTDYCPKQGRDLFLFFASLWSVELFRSSVTPSVHTLFSKWLHDKTSINWSSWLSTSFENNMISMYLLTNAEHFQSPSCKPIQVLKDIEVIDSTIVSFTH